MEWQSVGAGSARPSTRMGGEAPRPGSHAESGGQTLTYTLFFVRFATIFIYLLTLHGLFVSKILKVFVDFLRRCGLQDPERVF
jgi:hypothetical protein